MSQRVADASQCDKGPALSTVCGIEAGIVFSNVELAAALNALYQALGVAAGTEAAADCGAELEKSHTCHFGLDLSDPSLAPLVANVQRAADDLSIKTRVCAIDMDKVQYCNNLGTCELFIKNVSLAVIPKACTAEDGESYLAYLGRFSQCIKSDYGTKCNCSGRGLILLGAKLLLRRLGRRHRGEGWYFFAASLVQRHTHARHAACAAYLQSHRNSFTFFGRRLVVASAVVFVLEAEVAAIFFFFFSSSSSSRVRSRSNASSRFMSVTLRPFVSRP